MKYLSIGIAVLLAGGCGDQGLIEPPDAAPVQIEGTVPSESGSPLANTSDHEGTRPQQREGNRAPVCAATAPRRILIDASRDGGAWWFPQAGPVFDPQQTHQGQALAQYLRSRGYVVEELGRGEALTADLLTAFPYVVRFGEFGTYTEKEIAAYHRFLECDATLVLLSGHRTNDPRDELAESLGVVFGGSLSGSVDRFTDHDVTHGIGSLPWVGGTAVTAFDPNEVEILGWVGGTIPVMGTISSPTAKILFIGDTYAALFVDQPLIDNIIAWGFSAPPPRADYRLTVEVIGFGEVDDGSSAGLDCPGRCVAEYPAGSVQTLFAGAKFGATLAHWDGDCSSVDGHICRVTMDRDRTVIATFRPVN